MTATPSADATAVALDSLRTDDFVMTVEKTPIGKKLAYKNESDPFAITPAQISAFKKVLDEYEPLIIALHDLTSDTKTTDTRYLWHVGEEISAHSTREPAYNFLAEAAPFLNLTPQQLEYAVSIFELFEKPSEVPEITTTEGIAEVGEKCLQGGSKQEIVDAVSEI